MKSKARDTLRARNTFLKYTQKYRREAQTGTKRQNKYVISG